MLKIFKKLFLLTLVLLGLGWSLEVPRLVGRINDYANILSTEQRQSLNNFLAQYEQQTSTQLVLLTIPSLENDNLEDFSIRVAEKWKIGQKGKNNGLILLISKTDRKIRIEVGYGLEGTVTDAFCGDLIRSVIAPSFQAGNYYQGIYDAFYGIIQKIGGEFTADTSAPANQVSNNVNDIAWPDGIEIVFFALIVLGFIADVVKLPFLKKGLLGSVLLPILVFWLLGINFSWLILLSLLLFGWPLTFIMILISKIIQIFAASSISGSYSGSSFGSSSGGSSFSGGGGSFGGGASGGW